jgi:hypothetical protein
MATLSPGYTGLNQRLQGMQYRPLFAPVDESYQPLGRIDIGDVIPGNWIELGRCDEDGATFNVTDPEYDVMELGIARAEISRAVTKVGTPAIEMILEGGIEPFTNLTGASISNTNLGTTKVGENVANHVANGVKKAVLILAFDYHFNTQFQYYNPNCLVTWNRSSPDNHTFVTNLSIYPTVTEDGTFNNTPFDWVIWAFPLTPAAYYA